MTKDRGECGAWVVATWHTRADQADTRITRPGPGKTNTDTRDMI